MSNMTNIDCYAYSSRIRAVNPAQKAVLALVVLLLCLVLDRPAVGVLAACWMCGLARYWAGLPLSVFGRLLLAEGLFLMLAVAGVAISVGTSPLQSVSWNWNVGPLWFGSSPTSVETAARLATRALGGAAAMNFLALTTPLVDLIEIMRRLRMPAALVDILTLIYRFIFVLLESLSRMYTAQDSRLGYINLRRGMASAGLLATRLYEETYHRSFRLQTALESRGYCGDLRVLPMRYRSDWRPYWLGTGIVASLILARTLV